MKGDTATIFPFPGTSKPAARRTLEKDFFAALRSSNSAVILDLSDCGTFSQDDIELLLACLAHVAGRDTKVLLAAGSPVNRVVLDVTRISSLVPVFDSVAEALAHPGIPAVDSVVSQVSLSQSSQPSGSA